MHQLGRHGQLALTQQAWHDAGLIMLFAVIASGCVALGRVALAGHYADLARRVPSPRAPHPSNPPHPSHR